MNEETSKLYEESSRLYKEFMYAELAASEKIEECIVKMLSQTEEDYVYFGENESAIVIKEGNYGIESIYVISARLNEDHGVVLLTDEEEEVYLRDLSSVCDRMEILRHVKGALYD